MPYLKITCPELVESNFQQIAHRLTEEINNLFYHPKARLTRQELRERTTIHFVPYKANEIFIGGRTPKDRRKTDITIEFSDWFLSVKAQTKIAAALTPVVAELYGVLSSDRDNINIRFHSYPPTDFAVGGKLLSDIIPLAGRIAKKLFV